jgi:hypothetical protein
VVWLGLGSGRKADGSGLFVGMGGEKKKKKKNCAGRRFELLGRGGPTRPNHSSTSRSLDGIGSAVRAWMIKPSQKWADHACDVPFRQWTRWQRVSRRVAGGTPTEAWRRAVRI